MLDFFRNLFDTEGFPARWHCGQWSEAHGWLHVASDIAIFGAYAAIPLSIACFVWRRRDVPYTRLYWLFAAFIFSCGLGHLIEATIFWHPWYRFSGLVKLITAVVSWATVIALVQLLPAAIRLPGIAKLNKELQREIEERTRAEAEVRRLNDDLRQRVEELQTLLDVLPVGIGIATDPACRNIRTNPAFARMLALPQNANASKSAPPTEAPTHFEVFQAGRRLSPEELPLQTSASKGAVIRDFEEEIVFDDGRKLQLIGYAAPLYGKDGDVRGAVGAFMDITARKHAETERLEVERRLQDTQKLESLGVLAGGIAHDFNNLLTGILGNASLTRMDLPATSPVQPFLEEIEQSSRRAADLCRQMLAYSGHGRFAIVKLDLNAVITETARLLRVTISKKAELSVELAPTLPPVEADATQMRQVIMNLLINASEALGDRPGSLHLRTGTRILDRPTLAAMRHAPNAQDGEFVYAEVSDTGCGMNAETLSKIFDPFFTTKFTGRGLGLSAVLGIVRGHHGALDVQSEIGNGTTFRIYLPRAAGVAAEPVAPVAPAKEWRGSGTVLLADDEEPVRRLASRILKRLGFEVVEAVNGREAVERFRERDGKFTAVLLDFTMPDLNGAEACHEMLRTHPRTRVLLMSGYNEQDAVKNLPVESVAGFVQKPFTAEALQMRLQAALA